MKRLTLLTFGLLFLSLTGMAQVEVDKHIELTGSGSDARLSGIDEVSDPKDAVSAEVLQHNVITYAAATNTLNAFAVSLSPAPAYTTGLIVHFRASTDITGASSLNVNSLGAIAIKKNFNTDLAAGDIKNGQMVSVIFDGTYFQMLSQLGSAAGGAPVCPSGYVSTGSFCAETNERSAATHRQANYTCFANNGRLCSLYEWYYLCDNSGTFGMTNMTNNSEWTNHLDYTPNGCTSQNTTQTWYSATQTYRCCADKK